MKKDIHPTYHADAKITCACGNELTAGSTAEAVSTELCNMCHPFYTGTQKIIDSAQRVEKFQARTEKASDGDVRSKRDKKAARRKARADKQKEATKIS